MHWRFSCLEQLLTHISTFQDKSKGKDEVQGAVRDSMIVGGLMIVGRGIVQKWDRQPSKA